MFRKQFFGALVAVFHCDSFADELDQTLCLAAALQTHDQLNHFVHSPFQL